MGDGIRQQQLELFAAVKTCNIAAVRNLIDRGARLIATDEDGRTPLHYAAAYDAGITALLLDHGADPAGRDSEGATALHTACSAGNTQAVRVLAAYRDGSLHKKRDGSGMTALHAAAQEEDFEDVVAALLEYDNDEEFVEALDERVGFSALHWAAFEGHIETVKLLVQATGNVNVKSRDHETPLHLAAVNGNLEMTQLLLQQHGVDVNALTTDHTTPIARALAIGKGNVGEVVLALLEPQHQADITITDSAQGSLLHHACRKGHTHIVERLLQMKANVHARASQGETPLMVAAEKRHVDIVRLLLEAGAEVNTMDARHKSVTQYAGGSLQILAMLESRQLFHGDMYVLELSAPVASRSAVYRARHHSSGVAVVAKFHGNRVDWEREANLLQGLHGDPCDKHIVQLMTAQDIEAETSQLTGATDLWASCIFEDASCKVQDKPFVLILEKGDVTIKDLFQNEEDRSNSVITDIFSKVVNGVKLVQERGLVHCDLNTSNIMRFGSRYKIIDFEHVYLANTSANRLTTLELCAPEVAKEMDATGQGSFGVVKYSMHSWELGCLLYRLITLRAFIADVGAVKKIWAAQDSEEISAEKAREVLQALACMSQDEVDSVIDAKVGARKVAPYFHQGAASVLKRCLVLDPDVRLTVKDVQMHPFLTGDITVTARTAIVQSDIRTKGDEILTAVDALRTTLRLDIDAINASVTGVCDGILNVASLLVGIDKHSFPHTFLVRPHKKKQKKSIVDIAHVAVDFMKDILRLDVPLCLIDLVAHKKWEVVLLCDRCFCDVKVYVASAWRGTSRAEPPPWIPLLRLSVACVGLVRAAAVWAGVPLQTQEWDPVVQQQVTEAAAQKLQQSTFQVFHVLDKPSEQAQANLAKGKQQFEALLEGVLDPTRQWANVLTKCYQQDGTSGQQNSVQVPGPVLWLCDVCCASAGQGFTA